MYSDASARGGGGGRVSAIETDTKLFIVNLDFGVSTEDVKGTTKVILQGVMMPAFWRMFNFYRPISLLCLTTKRFAAADRKSVV